MVIKEKPSFSPVVWNGKVSSFGRSGHGSVSAFQALFQERVKLQELSGSFQERGSLSPEKYAAPHQKTRKGKSGRKAAGRHPVKDIRHCS